MVIWWNAVAVKIIYMDHHHTGWRGISSNSLSWPTILLRNLIPNCWWRVPASVFWGFRFVLYMWMIISGQKRFGYALNVWQLLISVNTGLHFLFPQEHYSFFFLLKQDSVWEICSGCSVLRFFSSLSVPWIYTIILHGPLAVIPM